MAKRRNKKTAAPILVDEVDELLEFIENGSSKKLIRKPRPKPSLGKKPRSKKAM